MKKNLFSICAIALLGAVAVTSCKDSDDLTNERLEREAAIAQCNTEIGKLQARATALETDMESVKGRVGSLEGRMTTAERDIAGILEDIAELTDKIQKNAENIQQNKEDIQKNADAIEEINTKIAEIEGKIADVYKDVTNALMDLPTGLQLNQVYNNSWGTFSSILTNVETNLLVAYYGTYSDGSPLPGEEVKLGTLNFTVNPLDLNVEENKWKLVNSVGEPTPIVLSAAVKAENPVQAGITRAENVYSYETVATVEFSDLKNGALAFDLASTNFLKEAKKALDTTTKPAISTFANFVYAFMNAAKTDKLALTSTFDIEFGENTISKTLVSGYDVKAIAVKPLGFDAVKSLGKPVYERAKVALAAVTKKVAEKAVETLKAHYPQLKPTIKTIAIKSVDVVNSIVEVYDVTDPTKVCAVRLKENIDDAALINGFLQDSKNFVSNHKGAINEVLDKYAAKIGNKLEQLVQPELFIYCEKYGLCRAGAEGDPTFCEGEVLLYPTSYSGELFIPIAKKVVKHDNDTLYESYGGSLAPVAVTAEKFYEPGVHSVTYEATDYTGTTITNTYWINIQ